MVKIKTRHYSLPIKLSPYRNEGPQGYLLRIAQNNLLAVSELKSLGINYDYELLVQHEFLPEETIDSKLHQFIRHVSEQWESNQRIFNTQIARFCPICITEIGHWRMEWELHFYDVCHHHGVWLVDQCSSCGSKLAWNRPMLERCQCGAMLSAESTRPCPTAMREIASTISQKILLDIDATVPLVLEKTDVEETQRLIRYLGNYMSIASGKNPLKMRHVGDLTNSWPVTSLAAEVIQNWPTAFHEALTRLELHGRMAGRPSLNEVFGQAYHYVFKALKGSAFDELRTQFEIWINQAWKGGLAKRNKRLTAAMLENAAWIPASMACDFLGISHQRLELLIREGTLEGETHISEKGRKFVMVRRDNLDQVKQHLFGQIDMKTAGKLLGLQKRRMRMLLTLLFKDAKKLGSSPGAPWSVSRLEVNQILELGQTLVSVYIPDEGCVSMGHILQYWTWNNHDIAGLLCSVRDGEIRPVNSLADAVGIAAWIFKEAELKHWKHKNMHGLGNWLTISQTARLLAIKEQVAYELVRMGYLKTEVMPMQMKAGTRVRRSTVTSFQEQYAFATELAALAGCSPRKLINQLAKMEIKPISGPQVDGMRQVMYLKSQRLNEIMATLYYDDEALNIT